MKSFVAVELNFTEMTPAQYGKMLSPPLSPATIIRRCQQGLLDAYQTEGGHWKIKVFKNETITKEQYESVKKENELLKAKIIAISKLIT